LSLQKNLRYRRVSEENNSRKKTNNRKGWADLRGSVGGGSHPRVPAYEIRERAKKKIRKRKQNNLLHGKAVQCRGLTCTGGFEKGGILKRDSRGVELAKGGCTKKHQGGVNS